MELTGSKAANETRAPSLGWMHAGFVLTGLGTMLLGPILPLLARQWQLTDAQSGQLLLAQFCGSFLGGVTVSHRLRRGLLAGTTLAAVGLAVFAEANGLGWACAGIAVGGFGIGRVITGINIVAGRRFTENRGSALMRLNFSWSFGAMLSPLLAALLASRYALPGLLGTFSAMFLVLAAVFWTQTRGMQAEAGAESVEAGGGAGLSAGVYVFFGAVLFVYGGLETSVSGWLTTFALRYGTGRLVPSEYTMVLLLAGLTGGRAVATGLLLRMKDTTLLRWALVLTTLCTAALAMAHTAGSIAWFAVALGLSMAPVFPASFSLLIGQGPKARQAGVVMAMSGLGAAALPSLMGVVSTRTGSLHVALVLPVGAALTLLGMSFAKARGKAREPAQPSGTRA